MTVVNKKSKAPALEQAHFGEHHAKVSFLVEKGWKWRIRLAQGRSDERLRTRREVTLEWQPDRRESIWQTA
jgi:hypothetical protein